PDPHLATSAVVVGTARLGAGSLLAQGGVVRSSHDGAVTVGAGSAVLENSVVVGDAAAPTVIGRRTVFGHRCLVVGATLGQLYDYRGIVPTVAPSAVLFPSAELTGDVVVGERTVIGAGVKIIGDSHGPVRIGADVQILENTVLHLLPDNDLVLDNGVIIGPGAMIHGCRIGARSVVEPGAIVCDGSVIGAGCIVRAGAVVKQRSQFAAGAD